MARRKPRKLPTAEQRNECIEFSNESSLHVSEMGVGATFVNRKRKRNCERSSATAAIARLYGKVARITLSVTIARSTSSLN